MWRFLWVWTLLFLIGASVAGWHEWPRALITYGLMPVVVPLIVRGFLKKRQRPFSPVEQLHAVLGLSAIVLVSGLGLNALVHTLVVVHYSTTLYPPLPVDVRQGFLVLQAPLYALIIRTLIQATIGHYRAYKNQKNSAAQTRQSPSEPSPENRLPADYHRS
jgi:hypothetical protein|tara:strand:- start:13358 stop:13840 length:483 start_codon:yes stop_codon:yes gene_type:complete